MKSLLLLIATGLATVTFSFAQKKSLKPSDVYLIKTVSSPQISPDGKWISYQVSRVDTTKDKRITQLWMCNIDGSENFPLTFGSESASNQQFSPDGKYISFLSSRQSETGAQIWLMDRRGGEANKITNIKKGELGSYSWSPDGKKIVFTLKEADFKGSKKPKTVEPIVIDRYHFKQDYQGYLTKRATHLYLLDLGTKKIDTLTKSDFDETSPNWSPDGKFIAFVSNVSPDPDKNENSDLFIIEPKPGAKAKQLTTFKGIDRDPHWSPDSKKIAYLRSTSDEDFIMYDQQILAVYDLEANKSVLLTEKLDRPVANPKFTADGKKINILITNNRERYLAMVDVNTLKIEKLTSGMQSVSDFENASENTSAILLSKPNLPSEIYTLNKKALKRLTFHQDSLFNNRTLAKVSGFESISKDGTKVSNILYQPSASKNNTLPTIFFIHGGPVGQDEYQFDLSRQMLAADSFNVVAVNYRGSNGRGLAFSKAIYADWGNKEVEDILGAADEAVKKGFADADKLGIGGWSYGGILTNYVTANDNRFKAACSGAGTGLMLSIYGTDQYITQLDNEVGKPWEVLEKYVKLSYPFFNIGKIKAPTLYMAGEKDFNVPATGSEQMYQALKAQGVDTQLIIYPNQNHGISIPSYQVDRFERYLKWYGKYLK